MNPADYRPQPGFNNQERFETAWMVGHPDSGYDIVDAPTRGKAKLLDPAGAEVFMDVRARRRRDCDGKTYAEARLIVWPCEDGADCSGCLCCEDGACTPEEQRNWYKRNYGYIPEDLE